MVSCYTGEVCSQPQCKNDKTEHGKGNERLLMLKTLVVMLPAHNAGHPGSKAGREHGSAAFLFFESV